TCGCWLSSQIGTNSTPRGSALLPVEGDLTRGLDAVFDRDARIARGEVGDGIAGDEIDRNARENEGVRAHRARFLDELAQRSVSRAHGAEDGCVGAGDLTVEPDVRRRTRHLAIRGRIGARDARIPAQRRRGRGQGGRIDTTRPNLFYRPTTRI